MVQISFGTAETVHPFRQPADDKRRGPRRRVLLSAVIVDHDFSTTFRCQVRDVSDQGARLNIPDCFLVPAGFWLIALSAGLAFEARLAWRRFPSLGVSLGEPIELNDPPTAVGRKLRRVWLGAVP